MSKHPYRLSHFPEFGETSPENLASRLSNLRYDGLRDYLSALAEKLSKDSESDGGRGRGNLAAHLQRAAFHLDDACYELRLAWEICEPYMKDGKDG